MAKRQTKFGRNDRTSEISAQSANAHQRKSSRKSSSLSPFAALKTLDFNGDASRSCECGSCSRRPFPAWPRRMSAAMAAAYCGEASQRAFLARVGPTKEFPLPRVREGRRVLWLKDDLDKAMSPVGNEAERDVAKDL